jgi:hypothetical protein
MRFKRERGSGLGTFFGVVRFECIRDSCVRVLITLRCRRRLRYGQFCRRNIVLRQTSTSPSVPCLERNTHISIVYVLLYSTTECRSSIEEMHSLHSARDVAPSRTAGVGTSSLPRLSYTCANTRETCLLIGIVYRSVPIILLLLRGKSCGSRSHRATRHLVADLSRPVLTIMPSSNDDASSHSRTRKLGSHGVAHW